MFQVIQQRDSYKSSSIGSGPQFYTKPPTSLPANQTIEFDEGPKITVFIGLLLDSCSFTVFFNLCISIQVT